MIVPKALAWFLVVFALAAWLPAGQAASSLFSTLLGTNAVGGADISNSEGQAAGSRPGSLLNSSWKDPDLEFYPDPDGPHLGLLYDSFGMTLKPRHRTEILGPLLQMESGPEYRAWALPPLISYTADDGIPFRELDVLYPLITLDRFGPEYRLQFLQWLNWAGGKTLSETNVNRFTLFPLYFQQRSKIPEKNYTAFFPIYGRLKNRFFRDEAFWVVWPAYIQSRKRDVTTYNYLYPFVHVRRGDGLRGWQFWPLFGRETKEVTYRTNNWDETILRGGHKKMFAAWPLFFKQTTGLGTTNVDRRNIFLPFYSIQRSDLRRSYTVPWPIGFSSTVDREQKYKEWGAPWPLVVFARGEGKHVSRILPLFSRGRTETLEQNSYLWPIYKYRRVTSDPLDRERTRILFFLYSDINEVNTETKVSKHRNDFWPFYTWHHDTLGNQRLQILAPLEPILPNNKSIERNYSPIWSLWRTEKNGATGRSSHSLLWNLYRSESSPDSRKCSLLFGLFQYQSNAGNKRWRVFYVPFGKKADSGPVQEVGLEPVEMMDDSLGETE